jgi:hypothetical protein
MFVRPTIREHFQRVQKRLTSSAVCVVLAAALVAVYVFLHATSQAALLAGAVIGIGIIFAVFLLSKRPSGSGGTNVPGAALISMTHCRVSTPTAACFLE